MFIEGNLMRSLACAAADVLNLNSFSLLPLGLARMSSLHFSLDKSSKSERRHLRQSNERLINGSQPGLKTLAPSEAKETVAERTT